MPLTPGQILNKRYRIVRQLGQGGFATIYRAEDLSLKTVCALKENLDNYEKRFGNIKDTISADHKFH